MYRIPRYRVSLVREGSSPIDSPRFVRCKELFDWAKKELFSDVDREQFWVVWLNANNKLLGYNLVSIGSLNSSLVHPREVWKPAILGNAAAVIFIHNHPGGSTNPSRDDRDCTKKLVKGGELLGIRVLDHVICGETNYYSFTEHGTLLGD